MVAPGGFNTQIDSLISDLHTEMDRVDHILSHNDVLLRSVKKQRFWFNIFRIPVYVLLPPMLILLAIIAWPMGQKGCRVYHWFLQRLHRFGLWVLGFRVSVINLNRTPLPHQVLFLGNADPSAPLVMQAYIPGDFRMVVGYKLFTQFRDFFVDYLMKKSKYLPVNPSQIRHLYRDIRRLRHFLDQGHRLGFAVQRQIDYQSPVVLLKYNPMPVVPVFVHFERAPNLANFTHPLSVKLVIGKPISIPPELVKNHHQKNEVFHLLIQQIDALSQHITHHA